MRMRLAGRTGAGTTLVNGPIGVMALLGLLGGLPGPAEGHGDRGQDKGPLVVVLAPHDGLAVNAATLRVQALVAAFRRHPAKTFVFDGQPVHGGNNGRISHVELSLDGILVERLEAGACRRQLLVDSRVDLTHVAAGPHTLTVTAYKDRHERIGGRVSGRVSVTFTLDPTLPLATDDPIPTPFACLVLDREGGNEEDDDADDGDRDRELDLEGRIGLGPRSDGFDPAQDRIVIAMGAHATVLEPGMLHCERRRHRHERECEFEDRSQPLLQRFGLEQKGEGTWRFELKGGPLPPEADSLYLRIGNDWGTLDLRTGELLLRLRSELDETHRVSRAIGPAGGTIATQDAAGAAIELTIPTGALVEETLITLTPVTAVANLPFSGGLKGAVHFEPSGLQLARPGTLKMTLPIGVPPSRLLGFTFDDGGSNLEVLRVAIAGGTVALPMTHFSTAGVAAATISDFERQVLPILNALPATLPPTQVATLISLVVTWIGDFGFGVCGQPNLCKTAFDIGAQSLAFHRAQACTQAASFVAQGEPFLARQALHSVVKVAASLVELGELATQAQVPGFEVQFDLACVADGLDAIVDLARSQAIANPRAGLLLLLVDVADDALLLDLPDVRNRALASLREGLASVLSQAEQACLTNPTAGEALLDLVLDNFTPGFLDGLDPGLDTRFHDARAGCRVRINPAATTVGVGEQVQFTGTVDGRSPSGVSWSLGSLTGGSTIDPITGLFTAGQFPRTVVVVATSLADVRLFKRATVTVVQIAVTVSPQSVTVNAGGTVQFTATVTGTANTAVTWTRSGGGTIDPSTGLFSAGSSAGTFTVRATSVAAPSVFAEATVRVTVVVAGFAGRYQGQHQEFDWGECSHDASGVCLNLPVAIVVEQSGSSLTLFYFPGGVVGNTALCGSISSTCIRYTAVLSGNSFSGDGVRFGGGPRLSALPITGSFSGNTMTGQAYWELDCPGGCFFDFNNVARVP